MSDDIRLIKITTKPQSENANFKFYHELISITQSGNDEKKTHTKTTWGQRRFEKMSRKRGLVEYFEHVT